MRASTTYWNSSMDITFTMKNNYHILLLTLIWLFSQACAATHEIYENKIDGVALESPRRPSTENVMTEIESIGADYVCLMPYAFVKEGEAEVRFDHTEWQWWGECTAGIEALIEQAKSNGLKVMIKPHVWLGWGDYTGDLNFVEPDDQQTWNASYLNYVMNYARLAEKHKVEIICIGTELCMQLNDEPDYWSDLISSVKEVYNGKLTYASNWDCYQDFPLWHRLDFIGIDAYFPITEEKNPELGDALDGWRYWKGELASYTDSVKKPILLTEYGYRSVEGCLAEPWVSGTGEDGIASQQQQLLAYEALYRYLWTEPWCAGGFLWKWHCAEHLEAERRLKDYSPQGKPALDVIKKQYSGQFLKKVE